MGDSATTQICFQTPAPLVLEAAFGENQRTEPEPPTITSASWGLMCPRSFRYRLALRNSSSCHSEVRRSKTPSSHARYT